MAATTRLLAVAAVLAGFGAGPAAADTIVPSGVEYWNNIDETDEIKVCEIVLDLSNPPAPEVVKFIVLAGYDKADATVLVGFLLGAAELTPQDEYDIVDLASGVFTSASFSSPGRLDHDVFDGSVMATTADAATSAAFVDAVLAGDFALTFSREGFEGVARTYEVGPAPPADVEQVFSECLEGLVAEAGVAGVSSHRGVSGPLRALAARELRRFPPAQQRGTFAMAEEEGEVTVEGCARPGVEAGCIMMRSADGALYNISAAQPKPEFGVRGRVTGTVSTGFSYCMQGILLSPATWEPIPGGTCTQEDAPDPRPKP